MKDFSYIHPDFYLDYLHAIFMMKDPGKYSSSEVNAIIRLHMDGHLPANDDYKVVTANDHVIVVTPDGNFAVCDDLLKSR